MEIGVYKVGGKIQCDWGEIGGGSAEDGNGGVQEEVDVQLFEGSGEIGGAEDVPPRFLQKVHWGHEQQQKQEMSLVRDQVRQKRCSWYHFVMIHAGSVWSFIYVVSCQNIH